MSACDHELYRDGDSWEEELGFSKHECRTGFNEIGIRYRSKKQLIEFITNNPTDDPLEGKFYLSYLDVRRGVTIYIRNHILVDDILNRLNAQKSANQRENQTNHFESHRDQTFTSLGIKNFKSRKSKLLTSRDEKSGVNSLYTNITTKITAAGKEAKKNSHDLTEVAAASEEKIKNIEPLIGDILTTSQKNQVLQIARSLSIQIQFPVEKLIEEISFTLLNRNSFTQAGNDFFKKLNTIKKIIESGRWLRPVEMDEEKRKTLKQHNQQYEQKCRELLGEINHWKKMIEMAGDQNKPELINYFTQQESKCQKALNGMQGDKIVYRDENIELLKNGRHHHEAND